MLGYWLGDGSSHNFGITTMDKEVEEYFDTLTKNDGSVVQISKCPNDHGKIKSPLCCGQDMICTT